jgi:glucosamine-6-phosphate deaminase
VIVSLCDDAAAASELAASRVADLLTDRADAVLGLPTGRTPLGMYAALVEHHEEGLDFSRVTTFNLDEFVGIGPDHPGSYHAYMADHFFSQVNVDPDRVHLLDGLAADLDAECARFEEAIEAAGGLDLQVLGIGANGHIGFNEPADALTARSHRVRLLEESRAGNAVFFGDDVTRVPTEALSMGMGTILKARRILLLATGASKQGALRGTVHGLVTTRLPASFLQLHPHVEIICDREAAAQLER